MWIQILARVPNSILWLLRFPAAGEQHLIRTATQWAGASVASRVIFTDVAPKHVHIHRGRIADLFLDTPECNAHTTAADILWSGTPILTFPRYSHKMCSRVGASIAYATGHGPEMIVHSEKEYEDRAVKLAQSCRWEYVEDSVLKHTLGLANPMTSTTGGVLHLAGNPMQLNGHVPGASLLAPQPPLHSATMTGVGRMNTIGTTAPSVHPQQFMQPAPLLGHPHPPFMNGQALQQPVLQPMMQQQQQQQRQSVVHWIGHGTLIELRRKLWENRDQSVLFDTLRWTRNLEKGLLEAWRRWENGQEFDELLERSMLNGQTNGGRPNSLRHGAQHYAHGGNIMVQDDNEPDMKAINLYGSILDNSGSSGNINGHSTGESSSGGSTLHSNSSGNSNSSSNSSNGNSSGHKTGSYDGAKSAAGPLDFGASSSSSASSSSGQGYNGESNFNRSLSFSGGGASGVSSVHPLYNSISRTMSAASALSTPITHTKKQQGAKETRYKANNGHSNTGTFEGGSFPEGQIDPGQHGESRRSSMIMPKSRDTIFVYEC